MAVFVKTPFYEKKKERTKMEKKAKRMLWFVLGVVINSFGIALTTKAAMGTSPISSNAGYTIHIR